MEEASGMTKSKKSSWDRERVAQILLEATVVEDNVEHVTENLAQLLSTVRQEALQWMWTEACSQHARGMDPRNSKVPKLLEKANADLNPERE